MRKRDKARRFGRCPAGASDLAEMYCLDRLLPGQAAQFEEHYLVCSRCAEAVREATEYVRDMRGALERLAGGPRLARSAGS